MQTKRDQTLPSSAIQADHGLFGKGREVARLRLLFLVPLTIFIVAIVTALMFALYWHEHKSVEEGVLRIRTSAQDFYEESIRYDARALQAVMDTLQRDPVLRTALAKRDRKQLLMHSGVLFDELKRDFSITHLYFSDTNRVNLLRVHSPERYGDRIDRVTTLSAEKNGKTSFGVELGPLGTFTLRLVTPWFDENHKLIGYVEVGIEIDRVLQKLREFFGFDVFVLVHKDRLDQKNWEDGMRALGHTPDWDRFPAVVLGSQTPQSVPPMLLERMARGELGDMPPILETEYGGASYQIALLPLKDAGAHIVAHMVLIADVSQETDAAQNTVYAGSLTALGIGILLLGFFYWQVGHIGHRIESDAQVLERLATHDGLTGLYNHRTFYTFLEEEVARARRYRKSLSLLMIDIDHFKRVNDTYGHQAGDVILRGLSALLTDKVRVIDKVCRYGGEEIAVLLPETNEAFELAERLRTAVAAAAFDIGAEKGIGVTVSIGLACFPGNSDSGEALVSAADSALYAAKRGGRNRVCGCGNTEVPDNG